MNERKEWKEKNEEKIMHLEESIKALDYLKKFRKMKENNQLSGEFTTCTYAFTSEAGEAFETKIVLPKELAFILEKVGRYTDIQENFPFIRDEDVLSVMTKYIDNPLKAKDKYRKVILTKPTEEELTHGGKVLKVFDYNMGQCYLIEDGFQETQPGLYYLGMPVDETDLNGSSPKYGSRNYTEDFTEFISYINMRIGEYKSTSWLKEKLCDYSHLSLKAIDLSCKKRNKKYNK